MPHAQAEEGALAQVAQPFHVGEATGLDGCTRRPVLVTCSLDRTVRIWNTQDKCAQSSAVCNFATQWS